MSQAADGAPQDLAARLLDAQVAWHLDRLQGDRLEATVRRIADGVLDAADERSLADVLGDDGRTTLVDLVVRGLRTVPGSAAVADLVRLGVELAAERPEVRPADVVDRARVVAVVDAALALAPLTAPALDRVSGNPLVAALAARFVTRVVTEVVAAGKPPAGLGALGGLGSLVSFGAAAATRAAGAADKSLESLLGEGVGSTLSKGGSAAAKRLNRVVLETLADPTTREALLQAWDLAAAEPVGPPSAEAVEKLGELADAGHALVVDLLASDQAGALAEAAVDGFLERFGHYTPAALLAELDVDRADVVADLVALAPGVVDSLRETGALERIIRTELEPFYASPDVRDLLDL